jgi:hypothetical protein
MNMRQFSHERIMEKLDRMFPPTGLESKNPQGQSRRERGTILRGVRRISCQPKNPESALTFPVFVRRARERNIAANLVKMLGAAKKKSPARAVIPHVQPRPVQQPRVGKPKPGRNPAFSPCAKAIADAECGREVCVGRMPLTYHRARL